MQLAQVSARDALSELSAPQPSHPGRTIPSRLKTPFRSDVKAETHPESVIAAPSPVTDSIKAAASSLWTGMTGTAGQEQGDRIRILGLGRSGQREASRSPPPGPKRHRCGAEAGGTAAGRCNGPLLGIGRGSSANTDGTRGVLPCAPNVFLLSKLLLSQLRSIRNESHHERHVPSELLSCWHDWSGSQVINWRIPIPLMHPL